MRGREVHLVSSYQGRKANKEIHDLVPIYNVLKKFKLVDSIIWENEDYFVVNKPPFIATLEDRNDRTNLLLQAKEYSSDAQACHRLDKDTSGVIVFAKNPDAYRHLSMQFEHREVKKIYHAVVDGNHGFEEVEVNARILKHSDGTVSIDRKGKSATTIFKTIQVFRQHSLVECRPVTGRMHQIRIHLTTLGAPITGDKPYGGKEFYLSSLKRGFNLKKATEEEPLMKRMALHARALTFSLLSGDPMDVEADYPKDFSALIRQLELNS